MINTLSKAVCLVTVITWHVPMPVLADTCPVTYDLNDPPEDVEVPIIPSIEEMIGLAEEGLPIHLHFGDPNPPDGVPEFYTDLWITIDLENQSADWIMVSQIPDGVEVVFGSMEFHQINDFQFEIDMDIMVAPAPSLNWEEYTYTIEISEDGSLGVQTLQNESTIWTSIVDEDTFTYYCPQQTQGFNNRYVFHPHNDFDIDDMHGPPLPTHPGYDLDCSECFIGVRNALRSCRQDEKNMLFLAGVAVIGATLACVVVTGGTLAAPCVGAGIVAAGSIGAAAYKHSYCIKNFRSGTADCRNLYDDCPPTW